MVDLVAHNLLGGLGPGGSDSEALPGLILKFREDRKNFRTSVETFIVWLSKGIPPWAAYHAFISGQLIVLGKQPEVRPFEVGEMRRHLFAKCVLVVMGPEATSAYQDDQICGGTKAVIDVFVHGVQAIWNTKSTMEDWGFLIVDAKEQLHQD